MYCKKLLQRLARFSCTVLQDTIAMFCKTFSHTFFLAQFCKKLLQRFARFSCTVLQNTIAMFCKIFLHSFARYFCNVLQDFLAVLQNTFATFWQEAFKIFYKTLHLTFFSKIFQWFSLLLPLALPTIPWDHKSLWCWFVWLSPPPPNPNPTPNPGELPPPIPPLILGVYTRELHTGQSHCPLSCSA